ncbi:MAG: amidase [Gammaproteobacteria bacterium]|nr:amidase [Gammaproteobacteria bacterium]
MTCDPELLKRTISDIAPLIERGELTAVDLVDAQLARIAALDDKLQSFLLVTADLAREQARAADREIAAGRYRGKLHGIPLGIKDLVAMKGLPRTCASPMLRDDRPDFDATIIEKLTTAGAICIGKLNLTEFALYGYHPDMPLPHNPWNLGYSAGVSSSGSGAATAASLCFGAIGTDTGGSIRFPSSMCGIVGIKPTFGKVSRHGVFPLADTLDHIGPMTRSVTDAALMLQVLQGRDERDPSTRSDPTVDYVSEIARGARGLKVGIDRAYCTADTDPAQADATFRACFMLKSQGLEIHEIDLTGILDGLAYWYTICAVDALLRHRAFYPARAAEYGPVFRAMLDYGAVATAEDYARGQRLRQATIATFDKALAEVDCILCPATASPAMPQEQFHPQGVVPPEAMPALVRYTGPTNLSGHPSITLPNGFNVEGLPTAMQFIGRHGDEATIIRAAAAYERATDWHKRRPPL